MINGILQRAELPITSALSSNQMKRSILLCIFLMAASLASACELCAIYSASSARGESGTGFLISVSEQFVSYGTLQFEGEKFEVGSPLEDAYHDSSITHVVPAYNFSSRFGVSLSIPIIYRTFRRIEIPSLGAPIDEESSEFGLGDMSLIARFAPVQKSGMSYSVNWNLMAGVKFPTGDTDRLEDEVERAERDREVFGPSHPHTSVGGIHQHDLTLGTGSYDGVFGSAFTVRWKRFYLHQQLQYYLRTEGEEYHYGDLLIASGGPGAYVILHDEFTISLQGNIFFEKMWEDEIIGQEIVHTGFDAWYAGPQVNLTFGEHFSGNIGLDIPVEIDNNGLQTVADYRVHGGVTWRF